MTQLELSLFDSLAATVKRVGRALGKTHRASSTSQPAASDGAGAADAVHNHDLLTGVADNLPTESLRGRATRKEPRQRADDDFVALVLSPEQRPATLDAAVIMLDASGTIPPNVVKRMASDVRMATKLALHTQRAGAVAITALPCAPSSLRSHIGAVLPARHRMTGKRWSSIKSSVIQVLKLTGWLAPNAELRAPLTPAWAAVAGHITPEPKRALIAAFARFCARQGADPAQVTEDLLEQYRAWRTERTLDLNVNHNVASVRCIWNGAARRHADWPGRPLTVPRDPRTYALPVDQFDPRFIADLEAYMCRRQTPSPLDPVFNRQLAPQSLLDMRGSLLRSASVLISKGIEVTSIRDIVAPDRFKIVLTELHTRLNVNGKWPSRACSVAGYLFAAARDWAELTPAQLEELRKMRRMVKAPKAEMKQKSRDRIAQFDDDPKLLSRFLELPHEMFAAAERLFKEGKPVRAAQLHQIALALAVLQTKPLRRGNLAKIEHNRHFRSVKALAYAELRIPGAETKNGMHLQAALPKWLALRVDRHIKVFRPLIERAPSSFLFPSPGGSHIAARTLAQNITKAVRKLAGAEFNVHLIRHLSATYLMDDDEANLPVAQALLGHSDEKTTRRYYAQQRTRGAQIKWMQTLERRVASSRRHANSSAGRHSAASGKGSQR